MSTGDCCDVDGHPRVEATAGSSGGVVVGPGVEMGLPRGPVLGGLADPTDCHLPVLRHNQVTFCQNLKICHFAPPPRISNARRATSILPISLRSHVWEARDWRTVDERMDGGLAEEQKWVESSIWSLEVERGRWKGKRIGRGKGSATSLVLDASLPLLHPSDKTQGESPRFSDNKASRTVFIDRFGLAIHPPPSLALSVPHAQRFSKNSCEFGFPCGEEYVGGSADLGVEVATGSCFVGRAVGQLLQKDPMGGHSEVGETASGPGGGGWGRHQFGSAGVDMPLRNKCLSEVAYYRQSAGGIASFPPPPTRWPGGAAFWKVSGLGKGWYWNHLGQGGSSDTSCPTCTPATVFFSA